MVKKIFSFSTYSHNKKKNNFQFPIIGIIKKTLLISLIILIISCGNDDNIQNAVPVIEAQSFNASESIIATELIGTVKASDINSDDKLTFSITTNDDNLFEITTDGKLSLASGKNLDFETTTSHNIIVKVTDGKDEASAKITINVIDFNENTAPAITNQSFDISENNTKNAVIGQIAATDAEGDALTYSLTSQSTNFSISSTGELKALVTLDYETTKNYTLDVSVSDGILSSTATITINVTDVDENDAFITTWKTSSFSQKVTIKTRASETGFTYDYTIDWGDGMSDQNVTGDITHTYATAGIYKVVIKEVFPAINLSAVPSSISQRLQSINQWGTIKWKTMKDAFKGCINVKELASDAPDLSNVTDMSAMFSNAAALNQDISNWNVSNVTNMRALFSKATSFNQDIDNWDVDKVTNMGGMFNGATSFNQNIGNWNVENVTVMSGMFQLATAFNQDIGGWNVSKVTNMQAMFYNAKAFNQDIGGWSVGNVFTMTQMFKNAESFNQNINTWNVSNVIYMVDMFNGAKAFNQDLHKWDVSRVISMNGMFNGASSFNGKINTWTLTKVNSMIRMFTDAKKFNQDISDWNVSKVKDMAWMFKGASSFNQNINKWEVKTVSNMANMFAGAAAFNQDISSWNVSNVENMFRMFFGASVFNQNIGGWNLSKVTDMRNMFYNATVFNQDLTGWDVTKVTGCLSFDVGSALTTNNRPNFTNCTP